MFSQVKQKNFLLLWKYDFLYTYPTICSCECCVKRSIINATDCLMFLMSKTTTKIWRTTPKLSITLNSFGDWAAHFSIHINDVDYAHDYPMMWIQPFHKGLFTRPTRHRSLTLGQEILQCAYLDKNVAAFQEEAQLTFMQFSFIWTTGRES